MYFSTSPYAQHIHTPQQFLFFFLLCLSLFVFANKAHSASSTYRLEPGQWHQLVIPGDPSAFNIETIFSSALPAEQYNSTWFIFRWNNSTGEYISPGLDDRLAVGEGFWIIQLTDDAVILDASMLDDAPVTSSSTCPSSNGCAEVTLFSDTSTSSFSMIGSAQSVDLPISSLTFIAPSVDGECADGCPHTVAAEAGLMEYSITRYNPKTQAFEDLNDVGILGPWQSAWFERNSEWSGTAASYLFPIQQNSVDEPAFVDMVAAPNGAPVSIFGTDVNGPLIVGGITMANCPIINETVYQVSETNTRLAKTTCWLEGVPQGTTTIKAGNSDEVPFTVNNGAVSTISSFAEFDAVMADPQPGDVFLLKGFSTDLMVDGKANGGKHTLWMRNAEHNGTEMMPISLVGYPGEPAKFIVSSATANANRAISLQNNWWTISNLDFETVWNSIGVDGEHRVVGNRVSGMIGPKYASGTATISAGGQSKGGYILGNTIFGGATNWRFDHAIYLSDCPDEKGWVVDWNYIHDNNFARGPQIVINHQPPRCGTGLENKSLASHYIRHNTVDTSFYRGRCIGINSFGWDPEQNPDAPEWAYIENNDLIDCGFVGTEVDAFGDSRNGPAISVARGGAFIQNNRLYRAYGGILLGRGGGREVKNFLGAVVKNNQIDVELGLDFYVDPAIADKVTFENNIIGPVQP